MNLNATQLRVKALDLMANLYAAKENASCSIDALMCSHCIYLVMSTMESEASNHDMQLILDSVESLFELLA